MDKLKKILSPGHKNDEEVMYGDSNTSRASGEGSQVPTSTSNTSGISGEDSHLHSSTGHRSNVGESSRPSGIPSHLSGPADDAASTASIRSGVVGAPESSKTSNAHSANYATGNTGSGSNFAQRDLPDRTLANEHERSFPLGSSNTSGQSHLGRDAALAGGAGAAGLGAHETRQHHGSTGTGNQFSPESEHQHLGHGHRFEGDPCPPGEEQKAPGYHHVQGPHSIDLANRLDPHVPGEFPAESGLDIQPLATTGSTGLETHRGHTGVPLAGAAGTAALGAHQHEKSHREAPFSGSSGYDDQKFDPAAAHGSKSTDSHGRNAAVGTAAGLAGVGAYEASKDHRSGPTATDPASKTVGPHSNNVANVLDPRVLPEPEKMKDRNTSGPHNSDTLNKLDPKVDATRRDDSTQHHYGRDAALAGGAGAAGVGAYEESRHTGHLQQDPSSLSAGRQFDSRAESDVSNTTQGHHYGRDAAVAGGVGAVGLGGYEATKKDRLGAPQQQQQPLATPTGAPQDARIFDQTQAVPDKNQVGAGWAADTKAQQKLEKERAKEAEKAEKAHEKAVKHDKSDAKAAEKAHDKALKHDKEEAKEAEKVHDKDEKKHGILGFLHRDKSPKDTPEERELKQQGNLREADQAAHLRHQRELEEAAAAGNINVAGASFEPSLQEQQQHSNTLSGQRFSTDEKGHNRLHKEPPTKVQRELDERSREQGTLGGTSTGSATGNDGIVTDERTGLPMNVGKYGTGHGGTDGSSNIAGYRQHGL